MRTNSYPGADPREGRFAKAAVLLINLGTPDAPTPGAVRRYLRQFLSDPRVIEIPRALWLPLLHGLVLNTRPRQSARKYASIWYEEGSPLRVHTERQARLLGKRLGPLARVDFAMRYGEPSIPGVLGRLKTEGHERILVFPLYPQYAASTTASAVDHVFEFLRGTRDLPEIRLVKEFHDHPAYLDSLAGLVREHWQRSGRSHKLIMSFHGLPQYTVARGDPYSLQCQRTARLLAERLGLAAAEWQTTFQSRFGRTAWIEPYTSEALADWGRRGVERVDVICPGFVADCLETLEEMGIEGRKVFLDSGGREFHLLPCLNERADWIDALAAMVRQHLSGWIEGLVPAP
ncbi:MAG TPA: ferrochelatase [Candidatus Eisenbacteria bacterium]|nr:ferrochelatase [Candidatus Eisenbacteria bacterium]